LQCVAVYACACVCARRPSLTSERDGKRYTYYVFATITLCHATFTQKKEIACACVCARDNEREGREEILTLSLCHNNSVSRHTHAKKKKMFACACVCTRENQQRDGKRYTYYVCATITLCLTISKDKKKTSTDHTATNALQQTATYTLRYCTFSQHTETHCNTLQHTATH